jgi:hypothetical protein
VLLLPVVIECFNARDCWSGVLLMPLWLIAFSLTLASSTGNGATNRGDAVQSKAGQIERYERASATLARLNVDLDTAKHAPQWETTAAYTMVGRKIAAYCDHIKELGREIRDASAIVDAGRPGQSDAQAANISWVLSRFSDAAPSAETISRAMPAWLVLAIECSSLAAFSAVSRPRQAMLCRPRVPASVKSFGGL